MCDYSEIGSRSLRVKVWLLLHTEARQPQVSWSQSPVSLSHCDPSITAESTMIPKLTKFLANNAENTFSSSATDDSAYQTTKESYIGWTLLMSPCPWGSFIQHPTTHLREWGSPYRDSTLTLCLLSINHKQAYLICDIPSCKSELRHCMKTLLR